MSWKAFGAKGYGKKSIARTDIIILGYGEPDTNLAVHEVEDVDHDSHGVRELCIEYATRVDPKRDPHAKDRKRLVQRKWVYECFAKGSLDLGENMGGWEIKYVYQCDSDAHTLESTTGHLRYQGHLRGRECWTRRFLLTK